MVLRAPGRSTRAEADLSSRLRIRSDMERSLLNSQRSLTQAFTMVETISKEFRSVCRLAGEYNKLAGPLRSSAPGGQRIIRHLSALGTEIGVGANLLSAGLAMTYSKGQSNLPKILWMGFVPVGSSVSTGLSVTVCFGNAGNGAVAGLMLPSSARSGFPSPVIRTSGALRIDVNGAKVESQYNDRFINPREFLLDSFDPVDLLSHMRQSVETLKLAAKASG